MINQQNSSFIHEECKVCQHRNHRLSCESCVRERAGKLPLSLLERTWALFQTPSENEPLRVGDSLFFCRLLKAERNSVVIQVEKVWPNQFWKFVLYRDLQTRGLGVIKEFRENGDHFRNYAKTLPEELAKRFFRKLLSRAEKALEEAKKQSRRA
ncbi:MAG: hypothetical protein GF308_08145 [Candidatus Heimdallarchaeota archaeon]|nr:hypothetical protein [Candidatus Heimdallarchaeota archaeon]